MRVVKRVIWGALLVTTNGCSDSDEPHAGASSTSSSTQAPAPTGTTTGLTEGTGMTSGSSDDSGELASSASSEATAGTTADGAASDGSAGTTDVAASTEGGAATATSSDGAFCPESAWFCEDFEALPPGEFEGDDRWTVVVNNADRENRSLEISEERPHSGRAALRATTAAGSNNNWQNFILHRFDDAPEPFYGRVFVYVAQFGIKTSSVHWYFLEHRAYGEYNGANPESTGHLVRIINGYYATGETTTSMTINYALPGQEMNSTSSTHDMFDGRWVCFEWWYDAAANDAALWLDGEEIGSGSAGSFDYPPAHAIALGAAATSGEYSQGFDVWLDDLALSSVRLGCGDEGS